MARSYRPVDRDQQFLMPPSLTEWLPADHLVWFVLDVVDQLDTSRFHARHPQAGPGRRAFDPDLLLAVLVYAYAVGERSSRRIEVLCREHVAFQVLCGRDVPDHSVIARFRAVHEDEFAGVFAQVLVLCGQAGMGKLGVVAIDGTKIAANASIFANRAEESLRAEAERIARQIAAEAAEVDAAEDKLYGEARGDELAPEFANPATRAAAIRAALAEIEAEKRKQAEEGGGEAERRAQGWQARAAARRHELAEAERAAAERVAAWQAAHEAAQAHGTPRPGGRPPVTEASEVRRLRAKLATAERRAVAAGSARSQGRLGTRKANLTDPQSRVMKTRTGWIQGYNAQLAVTADHLILAVLLTQSTDMDQFVTMMRAAQTAAAQTAAAQADGQQVYGQIGMLLADAGYCSEDNLTAEGPDRIIATGKDRNLAQQAVQDPRTGAPPEAASALDQMRHRTRTPEGLAAYKRRGAIVEPVNAHLKDQVGLRRFSRRGLTAAASELHLSAAVVNLLKLHRHQATAPAT